MTDQRPVGTEVADLAVHLVAEGPALDQKLAALAAMASQTSDVMAIHGRRYAEMSPRRRSSSRRDSCGSRSRRAAPAHDHQGGVVGEVGRLVLENAADQGADDLLGPA